MKAEILMDFSRQLTVHYIQCTCHNCGQLTRFYLQDKDKAFEEEAEHYKKLSEYYILECARYKKALDLLMSK